VFSKTHPVSVHVTLQDFHFVRAHVTPHREGFLVHGPEQTLELDADLLNVDQRVNGKVIQVPLLQSTVHGSTGALIALKASTPSFTGWHLGRLVRWKRVFGWVWDRFRDRKINDHLWRLMTRSLNFGFKRRAYADPACPCGHAMESIEHVYNGCVVFNVVWAWFREAWNTSMHKDLGNTLYDRLFCSVRPTSRLPRNTNDRLYWWFLSTAHTELIYTLWLNRCDAVMGNDVDAFNVASIAVRYRHRVTVALSTLANLRRFDGLQQLAEGFLGEISDPP
jgi:hypothetical protein